MGRRTLRSFLKNRIKTLRPRLFDHQAMSNLTVDDITGCCRTDQSDNTPMHEEPGQTKALSCFYGISTLIKKPGILLDELLQGTVDLVQLCWNHPEITCGRILFEGRAFVNGNFAETRWKLASEIVVNSRRAGILEIYYLEERPEKDEGPFRYEERALVDAVADRLGEIIERRLAVEALQAAYMNMEKTVRERTAELREANEELNKKILELSAKEKALESSEAHSRALNEHILNLFMVGSHDLRSPLISVAATLKLLMRDVYGNMDDSVRNTLADLAGRIHKVVGAAEECLGKSSVAIGTMEVEQKILDLRADIIDPVLDDLSDDIEMYQVVIDSRLGAIPGNRIQICANKVWLKIVFRNLFHNAVKYGGKGSRISFGFEDKGSYYKINVYNSGKPIPPAIRENLFSNLFKAQEASHEKTGMGMGLYLVKEIVEKHGGTIWYEPKDDGSNFVFTLPLV